MDDISREFPAEADGPRSRPRRGKGPVELSRLEGEEEAAAAAGERAVNRAFGAGSGGGGARGSDGGERGGERAGEREHDGEHGGRDADAAAAQDPAAGEAQVGQEQADDAGDAGDAADAGDAGDAADAVDAADAGDATDPVDADAARRAVAAEAGALELDDDESADPGDSEDGLPAVPELADAGAVARVVLVLLLSQPSGLSVLRLAQACDTTQKQVEQGLEVLRDHLAAVGAAVELLRTGDTIKLVSTPDAFPYLQRLRGVKKREKLSPAALETLAVIAYRQPVIRAEIEAIRGVKAGPMLRTLLQHKLIRITGRADVPGRPLQYGTTEHFLERFGLASLQELPSIKEFKQLG